MHPTAELIGAAATLVVLGILTLASVRSINRRRAEPPGEEHDEDAPTVGHHRRFSSVLAAAAVTAGLTLGTACGGDDRSTPAPRGNTTTAESPRGNDPAPRGRGEGDADTTRAESGPGLVTGFDRTAGF